MNELLGYRWNFQWKKLDVQRHISRVFGGGEGGDA